MADKPNEKPFFPYDFLFFGLTKDLLNLFDIPLMTETDANYFLSHTPINTEKYQSIQGLFKYIPEQHIFMNCLAKKYPSVYSIMQDCSDASAESIKAGEEALVNNFCCLNFEQYGIYPLKDSLKWLYTEKRFHMLFHEEWLELYKKYCDHDYRINTHFRKKFEIENLISKLKKHKNQFDNSSIINKPIALFKCFIDVLRIFMKIIIKSIIKLYLMLTKLL